MPKFEIEVSAESCIGAKMCIAIAPELFTFDETRGTSMARVPGTSSSANALEAAEACPVEAITVRNRTTDSQLFP